VRVRDFLDELLRQSSVDGIIRNYAYQVVGFGARPDIGSTATSHLGIYVESK
jgi:hypothetical protein